MDSGSGMRAKRGMKAGCKFAKRALRKRAPATLAVTVERESKVRESEVLTGVAQVPPPLSDSAAEAGGSSTPRRPPLCVRPVRRVHAPRCVLHRPQPAPTHKPASAHTRQTTTSQLRAPASHRHSRATTAVKCASVRALPAEAPSQAPWTTRALRGTSGPDRAVEAHAAAAA
eukprot:2228574-Pleurochrysis_carterae.AAC.1